MASDRKGGRILSVKEVSEREILNSSLMLFGESYKDPVFSKILSNLPGPVRFQDGVFSLKGIRIGEEDESFLFTYPHPFSPGKWITLYFGLSTASLSRSRFIFFYGWDSYILFRNGRPVERGNLSQKASFTSWDLADRSLNRIDIQRLKEHVVHLASPEMEGRFPGTLGYRKAQVYLANQLSEIGVTPIYQPFTIPVRDIAEATLFVVTARNQERLKAVPPHFSREGQWSGQEIDRYAFAFGSDHYPFYQAGTPSLDYFASDYRILHTFQDNPESVDYHPGRLDSLNQF